MNKSCKEIVELLRLFKAAAEQSLGLEIEAVSSAYSFITIDAVDIKHNEIHFELEITSTSVKLYKMSPNEGLKKKIESTQWPGLNAVTKQDLPAHVIKNLATADSVAGLAMNCARGDDYRPGNFSEIIYTDSSIELYQVNYMNAKSLDHKKDYSLRSLVFKVPMNEGQKLTWEFNDRSSENNRHCGDKIQAALDWMPD